MMIAKRPLVALTGVMLAMIPGLAGADIYVIANSDVALSAGEVRDVFIGEKEVAGATRLVPIDNAALQGEFLSKVLKLNSGRYESLWIKKSFREGLNAPAVKHTDAEVLGAVKSTPGAIGYVGSAPSGMKVIQKY